jgi:hypothetical protein
MAHVPRCTVRPGANLAMKLEGADTLLAVEYLPENFKPDGQRVFCVFKDGPDCDGEPIGSFPAQLADPIEGLPVELTDLLITATRASHDAIRPAPIHKVLLAGRLIGEGRHQLSEGRHVWEFSKIGPRVNTRIIPLESLSYAANPVMRAFGL